MCMTLIKEFCLQCSLRGMASLTGGEGVRSFSHSMIVSSDTFSCWTQSEPANVPVYLEEVHGMF